MRIENTRRDVHQLAILRGILVRRQPDLSRLVAGTGELTLSPDDRSEIIDLLTDELCERGLDPTSSEPNAYGLQIEALIDWLQGFSRGQGQGQV